MICFVSDRFNRFFQYLLIFFSPAVQHIDITLYHSNRCTELMGSIRYESLLLPMAFPHSVDQIIDGDLQTLKFHIFCRNPCIRILGVQTGNRLFKIMYTGAVKSYIGKFFCLYGNIIKGTQQLPHPACMKQFFCQHQHLGCQNHNSGNPYHFYGILNIVFIKLPCVCFDNIPPLAVALSRKASGCGFRIAGQKTFTPEKKSCTACDNQNHIQSKKIGKLSQPEIEIDFPGDRSHFIVLIHSKDSSLFHLCLFRCCRILRNKFPAYILTAAASDFCLFYLFPIPLLPHSLHRAQW